MSNVRQPACDGVAEGIGFAGGDVVFGSGAAAVEDDDEEDGNGTGAIATEAGGGVSGGVGMRTGRGSPDPVQHSTLHATTCNSTQCSTTSSQARMPQYVGPRMQRLRLEANFASNHPDVHDTETAPATRSNTTLETRLLEHYYSKGIETRPMARAACAASAPSAPLPL